jgi:hypothetical protein
MPNCEVNQGYLDEVNHQAYLDVLDVLPPQSSDPEYMKYYQDWANIAGPTHFDPYYSLADEIVY